MKKLCFMIGLVLLLTACSNYLGNNDRQYLYSKNAPRVVIPQPLTEENLSHFYDLPLQNQSAGVSIAPPLH